MAYHDGKVYLDLADDGWNVIEIDAQGWRPTKKPPVRFFRGVQKALPMPENKCDVRELQKFVNVEGEEDLMMLAAWLGAAFRPGFACPILIFLGEQGTAKTTASRNLKNLIDPTLAPVRSLPQNEDDLLVTARNNHVLAFDNISYLTAKTSDALCRLSTGAGIGKRSLYTNDEEHTIEAKRPIILNGINIPTERHDLLDRSIVVTLRRIPEDARKTEKALEKEFEAMKPGLLGSLLTGLSGALAREQSIELTEHPRMADFTQFAAAAMESWGWTAEEFLDHYEALRQSVAAEAAQSNAVLIAIAEYLEKKGHFEGSATGLLATLELELHDRLEDRNWRKNVKWPAKPNLLSRRIRAGAAGLRALGVGFADVGATSDRLLRLWWLRDGEPDWNARAQVSEEMQKMLVEDGKRIGAGEAKTVERPIDSQPTSLKKKARKKKARKK